MIDDMADSMVNSANPARETAVPAQTKTERLMSAITNRIAAGEFNPGDKLPSGSELITEYQVSRMTVRMAMERLKAAGVVESIAGSGYYVKD